MPDIDNVIKYYLDCSNGILFKDDALVATVNARKLYDNESSYVHMTITELI